MAAPARAVHRLNEGDRRIARIGAGVAAVAFVVIWAPSFPDAAALGAAGVGVAMGGLLYLSARRGSLLLTALAAFLVSFGPWNYLWVLGTPYIAWAALLLYRASKEVAAARTEAAAAAPAAARGPARAQAPAPSERRPPRESKRYTPPATKKRGRR